MTCHSNDTSADAGFTLMEMLIIVALLAMVMVGLMTNWIRQVQKGYDSRRKSDLHTIARALEEYYNDTGCYPPAVPTFSTCGEPGGTGLQPYLSYIPCDPQTRQPYAYDPADPTNLCTGYRLFANLANTDDPDISRLGCDGGCYGPVGANYNYGVSSGVPVGN